MDYYEQQIEQVVACFGSKPEILSSDLKDLLNFQSTAPTDWGNFLSRLITKKVIVRTERSEVKDSKPVFYYQLGALYSKAKHAETLLVDQHGKQYKCPMDKDEKDYIIELLSANASLELTLYKREKTYKAQINIIME